MASCMIMKYCVASSGCPGPNSSSARLGRSGTRAGIALQQQHAVGDLARGVPLWGSQCAIMQLQLLQCLAAAEDIIPYDEVTLVVIQPFRGVRTHSFLLALASWLLDQSTRDRPRVMW